MARRHRRVSAYGVRFVKLLATFKQAVQVSAVKTKILAQARGA